MPAPDLGPATLATTLTAGLDLDGGCTKCRRQIRVDTAALEGLAKRYGRDAILFEVMGRIVCSACGGKADLRVHVPGLAKGGARL